MENIFFNIRKWIFFLVNVVLATEVSTQVVAKRGIPALLQNINDYGRDDNPGTETPSNIFERAFYQIQLKYFWFEKIGKNISDLPSHVCLETFVNYTGCVIENITPDVPFAGEEKNGSYNGEIGLVQKGLADVTYHPMSYTTDRYEFADFTGPVMEDPLCLMVLKEPYIPFPKILLLPFQNNVWLSFLLSLGAVWLSWNVVFNFQLVKGQVNSLCDFWITKKCLSLKYILLCFLRGGDWGRAGADVAEITFRGACSRPDTSRPQRVLLCAPVLFMLVMSNVYQGKLLGFLTSLPRYPDPQLLSQVVPHLEQIFTYIISKSIYENEVSNEF